MALAAMLSALEVVPLTLLTLDAWDFVRVSRTTCDVCGKAVAIPHKRTCAFLIAVGVWNFVGAVIFGFLINLPIVSHYKVGMILTPNHGHAAARTQPGVLQPGASGDPGVARPAGGRHLHRVGRGSGRDGRGADVSGDAATPARRWNVTGRQEVGTRTGQAVRTEEVAGRFLEC